MQPDVREVLNTITATLLLDIRQMQYFVVCFQRTCDVNQLLPRYRTRVAKYYKRLCASKALGESYENAYRCRWQ